MKNNYTYCLIVWIAFIRLEQKAKLNLLYDKKKFFCNVVIPFGCTKLLEFNQYQKSNKTPFIIYVERAFSNIQKTFSYNIHLCLHHDYCL